MTKKLAKYIEARNRFPGIHVYDGCEKDYKIVQDYNKALCAKYPFLIPRNVWKGDILDGYDYSYTCADQMPDGWLIAFGEKLFAELLKASNKYPYNAEAAEWCGIKEQPSDMSKASFKDCWYFVDIKEKFGMLRMYATDVPQDILSILNKYEGISATTCIRCGKPATKLSRGWISPWCDECAKKIEIHETFTDIK